MEENSDFRSVQRKKKTSEILEKGQCFREGLVSYETFLFTKKDQICFDARTLNWKGNRWWSKPMWATAHSFITSDSPDP